MKNKKAVLWSAIIFVLCLLIALAHSKEQTYKVTITIEKTGTLKEIMKITEKYGNLGKVTITPVDADSSFPRHYYHQQNLLPYKYYQYKIDSSFGQSPIISL